MFLANKELEKLKNNVFSDDVNDVIVGEVSYELRIGNEAYLSGTNKLINVKKKGYVTIQPGMFAALVTYERVKIPTNKIGFISLKFSLKSQGLVNISGFHVDPGYKGRLVFTVFNISPHPIVLRYKQEAFLLFLADITSEISYKGKPYEKIGSKIMTPLTGEQLNFVQVESKIKSIDARVNMLIGTGIALFGVLIGIIVRLLTQGHH